MGGNHIASKSPGGFFDQRGQDQDEADWQLVTRLRNGFLANMGTMEGWAKSKDTIIADERIRLRKEVQHGL
jgi:hypothetical protein